jgi:DNA-binding ferritin-like protein
MATAAKNVVESLRDIVQDLLVPEFKALKVSVDAMREDMRELRADLKDSAESLRTEMKLRDDRQDQAMRNLTEKLSFAIDIRERLASLEARMPRQ